MVPAVHLLEPRHVAHVDVAARITLALVLFNERAALVRARVVQRGEDLARNRDGDVGDVEERIREGRGRQLVVLRERARVEVEALRARVRDHDVGRGRARVVDGERVPHRLGEEREERVVRWVWDPVDGGKRWWSMMGTETYWLRV